MPTKGMKGRRGKGTSRQPKKKPAAKKAGRIAPRQPFELLPHPADVGFVARGGTLEELFAVAAQALCDTGWELDRVRAREEVHIRARAATLEDLLYSWLSEVLFLSDAEHWVFREFRVARVTAASPPERLWEVHGSGRGERFDKRRHRARTYIKAVTYHQLAVKETQDGWQATVYLDV